MGSKDKQLKDKIVQQAIRSVRRDHKVDEVSLLAISKELNIEFSELTKYFNSMEDIFLDLQKKDWKSTFKLLDKRINVHTKLTDLYKEILD